MTDLQSNLLDLRKELKIIEMSSCSFIYNNQTKKTDAIYTSLNTSLLEKVANKLHQNIQKHDKQTLHMFCESNQENILEVSRSLKELSQNPKIRSMYDKIFQKTLCVPSNQPLQITLVFNDFIKGITYFQQEGISNTVPLYHRLTSCGPKNNKSFREHYNHCHESMEKTHKKHVKNYITNCYIERLQSCTNKCDNAIYSTKHVKIWF
jgi:hypothetical protein